MKFKARNTTFETRSQITKSYKRHMSQFRASSHRFRHINIWFFYFENEGEGHGVQLFLKWWLSMANIEIYERHILHFAQALTVSDILIFKQFTLKL